MWRICAFALLVFVANFSTGAQDKKAKPKKTEEKRESVEEERTRYYDIFDRLRKQKHVTLGESPSVRFPASAFRLAMGEIGQFREVQVESIVNKQDAFVNLLFTERGYDTPAGRNPAIIKGQEPPMVLRTTKVLVLFSGVDLKERVDGQMLDQTTPILEVVGQARHPSGRTVFKMKPANQEKIDKYFREWAARENNIIEIAARHEKELQERIEAKKQAEAKEKAAAKREKDASDKLSGAKFLKENGSTDKAKDRLKEIVKDFPGTKAASEASELLTKW